MPAFMVECTSKGNLPRAAQNMKIEAAGDKAKAQAAFDAAEKDGTRVKPEFGSVWYHYMGADADHCSHPHDNRRSRCHHAVSRPA